MVFSENARSPRFSWPWAWGTENADTTGSFWQLLHTFDGCEAMLGFCVVLRVENGGTPTPRGYHGFFLAAYPKKLPFAFKISGFKMVVTRSYQGMMVITMPLIQSRFLQVLGWKTSKIPPPCAVSQNQDEAWRCSSRGSSTIIGPKPCRLAAGGKCLDLIGTWMRRKTHRN